MGTLYGVWFESYLRGGPPFYGDGVYNLFDTLVSAQKGIDTLFWIFTSTRRFVWRPSAVSFVLTGCVSPNPLAVTQPAGIVEFFLSQSTTARARLSDNVWFDSIEPTLSVWPSTRMGRPG